MKNQFFNSLTTLVFLVFSSVAEAQEKYTISGTITDSNTGESLIGASIYLTDTQKGTMTNAYGFYSITLPQSDSIGLVISYIGYQPQIKKIYLTNDIELNVKLVPGVLQLEGVEVVGTALNADNVERAQTGVVNVPIQKIKELPVILGETDVLKVIQLLPGVQSGNEGTTGFYVRGGNADQNMVLLDEAIVYNPNHLFGLFSTFNSRALNNVTLIKGGFPAKYGGRLSSFLDIKMREGNNQEFKTEGGIGLITSQLTVEGPIKKDISSFIVSGRRTYIDIITEPFLTGDRSTSYHFYDVNAKINYKLSSKDRLYLSLFNGSDIAKYREAQGLKYDIRFGNLTSTLRWNHVLNKKLFSNTSVIFNRFEQDITSTQDNSFSQVVNSIKDVSGKVEFQYFPNTSHSITFGGNFTYHVFASSGKTESQSGVSQVTGIDLKKVPKKYFNEYSFYISDEFKISESISMNLGLRSASFSSSSVDYNRLEPRATSRVKTGLNSSVKASYTQMNQYLHLIPSSTASIPTDIWIPSSKKTKPQFSEQISMGYFKNFVQNKYEASIELYYKEMDNQVLFSEGNQLIESLDLDSTLTYGKGDSYGAELFIRKNTGRFTGWLSYTISKTTQQFDDLNFGKEFPFKYDRRHVVSLVGSYTFNERWSLSAVFTASSGSVITLPEGRFSVINGPTIFEGNYFIYESRNNARMPISHRLDISASYKKKRKIFGKEYESEWVFGLYNAYSRQNPYFIYYYIDPKSDQPKAKQVSLLPILPSVSYNFKF